MGACPPTSSGGTPSRTTGRASKPSLKKSLQKYPPPLSPSGQPLPPSLTLSAPPSPPAKKSRK
eukprot:CAMPEP_0197551410 /NCGR_PEP_ID=MMETSP1320-20131121/4688_1 /TAXON_ID=91990 /ORGANISM="Bolidomonas sp., Strain RCC2347" /LENGTH=62 /DNA_ID=CAMNT_0043111903 /DNA_START=84 /DNA_END=269 /DNA_ORIENTATION=-